MTQSTMDINYSIFNYSVPDSWYEGVYKDINPRLPGHGTTWKDFARTTKEDWMGTAEHALKDLQSEETAVQVLLDKSNIQELVCGKTHLVKYGKPIDNTDPSLAPRTAAGTNKDGNRVYVVIVDELTSNSPRNGINYHDLACCMNKLGSYHAVNLDGGGSSTFLIKEGDTFRAWNKQPGATHRAVADGMVLTVKDP